MLYTEQITPTKTQEMFLKKNDQLLAFMSTFNIQVEPCFIIYRMLQCIPLICLLILVKLSNNICLIRASYKA